MGLPIIHLDSAGSGGVADALADVLLVGNTTGPTPISITDSMYIEWNEGVAGSRLNSAVVTSSPKVWTLPDKTGTIALTSDIANASLATKSGIALNASFSGTPKKTAAIVFSTAFSDANYSIVVTAHTQNNASFVLSVESILAGSFIINANSNNIADLIDVRWTATKNGETT